MNQRVNDTAFQMATSNIRFGPGVTREVGWDLAELGARRVLLVTDPVMSQLAPVQAAREALRQAKIDFDVYDRVRVEPTDVSMLEAIDFARNGQYDAFIAV